MLRGLISACALGAAALVATGCGTVGLPQEGSGDVVAGKELFGEKCGACHTLADAGTQAQIGPNLDDAFRQSRADGLGETTIESVVRGQIAYPVTDPPTGAPGMPADIVTGQDAESVAAYVASVAGLPVASQPPTDTGGGTETETTGGGTTTDQTSTGQTSTGQTTTGETAPDGASVFADAGCGSCHTLAAAGSSGTIGPNLDEVKPSHDLVVERVTEGMGAMPSFADSLSEAQIAAVADYVVKSTGG